jgi:hypothetical protein
MADMTYEMTVPVTVKFSITEKERSEAIAYGVERGWLDKNDPDGDPKTNMEYEDTDVIVELCHMGRLSMVSLVKDAVDEMRDSEIAGSCLELDASEDEEED